MGIFIRTLIVTLLFCGGYFLWTYFAKEGYSPELQITKEAKNVVMQDSSNVNEKQPINEQIDSKALQELSIPFLSNEGNIKYVKRKAKHKTLYSALGLLLKGPTDEEKQLGIFTEIPEGTKLISVKRNEAENSIIINLTGEFGAGGGTQSVLARLNQIVRTADLYGGKLPVYLYLDGKKAQDLGGEGIFIEQPINKH